MRGTVDATGQSKRPSMLEPLLQSASPASGLCEGFTGECHWRQGFQAHSKRDRRARNAKDRRCNRPTSNLLYYLFRVIYKQGHIVTVCTRRCSSTLQSLRDLWIGDDMQEEGKRAFLNTFYLVL